MQISHAVILVIWATVVCKFSCQISQLSNLKTESERLKMGKFSLAAIGNNNNWHECHSRKSNEQK